MSGCLKGKSECSNEKAEFACSKCGALSKKKKRLCKPEKTKRKTP